MSRDSQSDAGRMGSGPPSRESMSMDVLDPIYTLADQVAENPEMFGTTASDYAGSTAEYHRRGPGPAGD